MTQEVEIRERIARHLSRAVNQIDWDGGLDTVGLGSLQLVEVFVDLQETFRVPLFHDDMNRIESLNDLVQVLCGRMLYGPSFGRSKVDTRGETAEAAGV